MEGNTAQFTLSGKYSKITLQLPAGQKEQSQLLIHRHTASHECGVKPTTVHCLNTRHKEGLIRNRHLALKWVWLADEYILHHVHSRTCAVRKQDEVFFFLMGRNLVEAIYCSAQLSMFNTEKHYRNKIIIIIKHSTILLIIKRSTSASCHILGTCSPSVFGVNTFLIHTVGDCIPMIKC